MFIYKKQCFKLEDSIELCYTTVSNLTKRENLNCNTVTNLVGWIVCLGL